MPLATCMGVFDFGRENKSEWVERFEQTKTQFKTPVFDVEVRLTPEKKTSASHFIIATENNIIWQKERLWNWLSIQVPMKYDKLMFVDADVIFHNKNVVEEVEAMLDVCDVLQPFNATRQFYGRAHTILKMDRPTGYPGLAWACRRDWLVSIGGFYDRLGTCWGDLVFANSIGYSKYGLYPPYMGTFMPSRSYFDVLQYICRVSSRPTRLGVVEGFLEHLDHGTLQGRQYHRQTRPLIACDFDPFFDVTISANGLLAWNTYDTFLQRASNHYFQTRDND